MAHNVQGFLLCSHSVIRQPEPLLSKVNAPDRYRGNVIFCCSALFVKPGLQMISERDDQYIFVSQHSRKPHVRRIQVFQMILQLQKVDRNYNCLENPGYRRIVQIIFGFVESR